MSLKSVPVLVVLAVALGAPAFAQEQQTIQPGYWDVTNKVQAVVAKTSHEQRCVKPAEVAKFVMGPSNHHYACAYSTRVFQDGKITLKGQCSNKKGGQVEIAATGSYSPTTFKMVADVDTIYAGIPLAGRFTTDARRIGDICPPDAKGG